MKITFCGAARAVTGSQHLIEVDGRKLLLDCGLYQGERLESYERNQRFPFKPVDVDAVILSHAHIDHSGNLPNLVARGYAGKIFCTPATAKLADVMLRDSGSIQESDVEFITRLYAEQGIDEQVRPIYTEKDAAVVSRHLRPMEYNQEFTPIPGVTARFIEAGHILGSAAVSLQIQENGTTKHLWFSGDIGRRNLLLLKDPVLPSDVDYLIMEATYGNQSHDDPRKAEEELCAVVSRTIKRGGKVIVPAFAVGRTQEIVYAVNRMIQNGDIPPVPVFVDSPLATEASQIFQDFRRYYDQDARNFERAEQTPPLDFEQLTYISAASESKKLNEMDEPMVIISSSGMAETGRIVHHLRRNIEDARNTILLVSFMAPGTLGRRLKDGAKEVRMHGQNYTVNAEVVSISGLSAHAGRDLLIEYALASKDRLKRIMLVHAEEDAATALQDTLLDLGIPEVDYPELNEEMVL